MADINVEMLKERLYKVASALFKIGETCVDASKQHIGAEKALDKIRNYLHDTDIICSKYRVDKLIEECMEPQVYNWFEDYGKKYLEINGLDYPDCCDGCSNNPKNGGSGICNCTLPYMQNPVAYSATYIDDSSCMVNNVEDRAFIFGKRKQGAEPTEEEKTASTQRIAKAIENMKKYEKR